MTDREKLVELLCQATFGVNKQTIESYLPPSAIAEVSDHLLANGVIVLPCKVGDTVWTISRVNKAVSMYKVAGFLHTGAFWKVRIVKEIQSWVGNKTEHKYVAFGAFGKTVFFTREEAEAALKEGQ